MNIVMIGGGTGSFVVLKGLKGKVEKLSAVVSMFDHGGSTGVLRDEFGILPPGDVRRCLVALSDESLLRELFMFRFDERVKSHSFGNLFLTALSQITKSDEKAIEAASRFLRIQGEVLPVSYDNCELCAKFEDGSVIRREEKIPLYDPKIRIVSEWLEPSARANSKAIHAIKEADMVVIGPGDLFTSIVPNLLVDGVCDALKGTHVVFVCNLMTKPGETGDFSASGHLKELIKYGVDPKVIVCNESSPNSSLLEKYAKEGQFPVFIDRDEIERLEVRLVVSDIMSSPDLIRHDSEKLAKVLLECARSK